MVKLTIGTPVAVPVVSVAVPRDGLVPVGAVSVSRAVAMPVSIRVSIAIAVGAQVIQTAPVGMSVAFHQGVAIAILTGCLERVIISMGISGPVGVSIAISIRVSVSIAVVAPGAGERGNQRVAADRCGGCILQVQDAIQARATLAGRSSAGGPSDVLGIPVSVAAAID